MKKLFIVSVLTGLVVLLSSGVKIKDGMVNQTGSPGESTCAACHGDGTVNTGLGSMSISANPAFTNNEYTPNAIYQITVTVSESGKNLFGFDFEALTNSNTNAGTLTVTDVSTTQALSATKMNIVHKSGGVSSPNSAAFTFNWTAPASGEVNFYTAGNAANGNGSADSGDEIYTASLQLSTSSTGIQMLESNNLQIYPNPANDKVTVKLNLVSSENISMALYSMEGKLYKIISDNQFSSGVYHQSFSTEGIPPGVYFLKVNSLSGKLNQMQKMLIQ